ncbi:MAG TPA: hypothetical protein VIK63_03475 [Haloplasmataceae bacterium]
MAGKKEGPSIPCGPNSNIQGGMEMAHLQITIDQEQVKSLLQEDIELAKLVEAVLN